MLNGFDERVQTVLRGLPPRTKRHGLGAVKSALIAAAASPGLRGMLADVLGSFAPYAQEQDDTAYIVDFFEFKVLSAIADNFTVRVYTQATDLIGKGRLDIHGNTWLGAAPWLEILVSEPENGISVIGGSSYTSFDHCDPETQTAVLVTTAWKRAGDSLSGAVLQVDSINKLMNDPNAESITIPLEVKAAPTKTLVTFSNKTLFDRQVEELRLSPLGLTVIIRKPNVLPQSSFNVSFSPQFKDSSTVEVDCGISSGHSTYKTPDGNENWTENSAGAFGGVWCRLFRE